MYRTSHAWVILCFLSCIVRLFVSLLDCFVSFVLLVFFCHVCFVCPVRLFACFLCVVLLLVLLVRLFVCLFVCLRARLFVCLLACLFFGLLFLFSLFCLYRSFVCLLVSSLAYTLAACAPSEWRWESSAASTAIPCVFGRTARGS